MSAMDHATISEHVRSHGGGTPYVCVRSESFGRDVTDRVNRALDVSISLVALTLLFPVMLALIVAIRVDGGPAVFQQLRVGRGGKLFWCLKFRSMTTDAASRLETLLKTDVEARLEWAEHQKLRNDPRITPLGRFLRISSLDELPQLFNVLTGDMSLVGPRPIVPDEVLRYGRFAGVYSSLRPGLTGLWQVSGRNNVSYRRRVAMDRLFAKRRSVRLYLIILLKTIPAILMRTGV